MSHVFNSLEETINNKNIYIVRGRTLFFIKIDKWSNILIAELLTALKTIVSQCYLGD